MGLLVSLTASSTRLRRAQLGPTLLHSPCGEKVGEDLEVEVRRVMAFLALGLVLFVSKSNRPRRTRVWIFFVDLWLNLCY